MNRKRALCLFLVLSFAFGDTVSLNSIVKYHFEAGAGEAGWEWGG